MPSFVAGCADDGQTPGGDTVAADVTADLSTPDGSAEDTSIADTALDDASVADTLVGDTTEPNDTTVTPDVPDVPEIPEPNVAPDPNNCSARGGDVNVFDLQDPACPDHMFPEPEGTPGVYVELQGLVITANFGDTFFAQDPRGGPYSGITIFAHGLYRDEAVPGLLVNIKGNYSEFFENTQVYLTELEIVRETFVPLPFEALHPSHIATNGPLAEMFEGVLVKVVDVHTTHTQPDCPFDFGEFEVSSGLRIDDMGFRWGARLGDRFTSITGPLNYSFGNHKIEPRDESDIVTTAVGGPNAISKCIANECQAPAEMTGTRQVVVNEIMADPMGSDTNQEWIELYNPGNTAVDINGWQIRDCATQALTLRGPNLVVPAKGYLVVGMSNNPAANGGVDVDLAYGNSSFYMPNTVGAVLIYDGPGLEANLVDQTRFSRFGDWSSIFRSGYSIERRSATADGTLPASWARARDSYGEGGNYGTPGARNDAR
jgi:hypothetical protein